MIRPALTIEYKLRRDSTEVIGILRTDRGSKYRGRSFTISKEGKSKEEYEREVAEATDKLLHGTE